MTEKVGVVIGESLGDVEVVETCGNRLAWGKYLRLRVSINVTKPLKKYKRIKFNSQDRTLVNFKYEKLGDFCYICGMLDHLEQDCPKALSLLKEGKSIVRDFDSQLRVEGGSYNAFYMVDKSSKSSPVPSSSEGSGSWGHQRWRINNVASHSQSGAGIHGAWCGGEEVDDHEGAGLNNTTLSDLSSNPPVDTMVVHSRDDVVNANAMNNVNTPDETTSMTVGEIHSDKGRGSKDYVRTDSVLTTQYPAITQYGELSSQKEVSRHDVGLDLVSVPIQFNSGLATSSKPNPTWKRRKDPTSHKPTNNVRDSASKSKKRCVASQEDLRSFKKGRDLVEPISSTDKLVLRENITDGAGNTLHSGQTLFEASHITVSPEAVADDAQPRLQQ
ncbi:hypothetical protein DITRI_Ditri19aG0032300 [Diplodiscus trichospermus]